MLKITYAFKMNNSDSKTKKKTMPKLLKTLSMKNSLKETNS